MEGKDLGSVFNIFGFIVVTGLVSWLLSKVYEMDRHIRKSLNDHFKQVDEILSKERNESVLAHRRLDVLDESVGEFADLPFNSKHVADGRQPSPSFKRLQESLFIVENERKRDA